MMKQNVTLLLLFLFLSSVVNSNPALYQKVVTDPVIVSGCELTDRSYLPTIEAKLADLAPDLNPERQDILSWQAMALFVNESLRKQTTISSDEIASYYQEMNHLYVHDNAAYFEYIFAPVTESNRSDQKELLEDFRIQLKENETNWTELKVRAQTNSLIVSPKRTVATPGKFSPLIDAAVFATPEGEVSEVVETDKGFHLIYVNKQIPIKNQSLEQVSDQIREVLHQKKVYEKRNDLLDQLRKKYPLRPTENNGFKIGLDQVTSKHLEEVGLPEIDQSNEKLMNKLESSADAIRLYLHGSEIMGTDDEEYLLARSYLMNNFRANSYLEFIQSNASSTIEELENEYEENKAEYFSEEQRHVISFEMPVDSSSPEQMIQSQELAKSTLSNLKKALAEGKTIEEAKAINESIRLIDLGMAPVGPRGPLVDLSVEELKVGETTGVILQQQRAFVFYLADIEPECQLSFEESKEQIKINVENERGVQERNELVCSIVEKITEDKR